MFRLGKRIGAERPAEKRPIGAKILACQPNTWRPLGGESVSWPV